MTLKNGLEASVRDGIFRGAAIILTSFAWTLGCAQASGTVPLDSGSARRGDAAWSILDASSAPCALTYLMVGDAGPDGVLHTSDDVVIGVRRDERDEEGRLTRQWLLSSRGVDAMWGTGDDVPAQYVEFRVSDSRSEATTFDAPGSDGVWGTHDDVGRTRSTVMRHDETGVDLGETVAAGLDGRLDTPDDLIERALQARRTEGATWAEPAYASHLYFSAPGPDGAWHTSDDLVAYALRHERLADGSLATFTSLEPGVDGEWGNADDPTSALGRRACYRDAGEAWWRVYGAAGPDSTWGTDDDALTSEFAMVASSCAEFECPPELF